MTMDLAVSLPLDRISVNPVIPFPGSRIYGDLVSTGKLDPTKVDWAAFNRLDWFPNTGVSSKTLAAYAKRISIKFYLRPRRLLRILSRVRSWSEIEGLLLGLKVLLRETGRTFKGG